MFSIEQRDKQLLGTSAAIRYSLSFPQAAQHLVHVAMEVDTSEPEITLALPNWIPGSYMIRNFASNQADLAVTDAEGRRLETEWLATNRLRVRTDGAPTVHARWSCYGYERSVRHSHISRIHAFINPANCLMYVEGRTQEVHHVAIDHSWNAVSTALSPVRSGVWGALNYDILVDSPLEIGDHYVAHYERHGAQHEIAITGTGDFDAEWLVEQTRRIVDHGVAMFGSLPYDRYVFIIQFVPGIVTGLEHARSSVNTCDAIGNSDPDIARRALVLLCHEYFHLWNVKRIRPRELGPFDYQNGNPTRMLWLAEGVTSYYDDRSAYRCGFHSREEYLQTVGDEIVAHLYDTPGWRSMPIKDSSFLAWVKLYMPTPDSSNRFSSYYSHGSVIFTLLDFHIIAESGGARSLDDGMRALWERYQQNPAVGVTEEEFIEIVSRGTGVDVGPLLRNWLNTTEPIDAAPILARFGLEIRERRELPFRFFGAGLEAQPPVPSRWMGLHLADIPGGVKVAKVVRDSPAERAGVGAEDEVIAVNGTRVTSTRSMDSIVRGQRDAESIVITAVSDGRLYETTLHFAPRTSFMLAEMADMSVEQRNLLDAWLSWMPTLVEQG